MFQMINIHEDITKWHFGGTALDDNNLNADIVNIFVHQCTDGLKRISMIIPSNNAMSYPILFINGEQKWSTDFKDQFGVSLKACVQFQLQRRPPDDEGGISPIPLFGKLFQQWVIDQYIWIKENNM